jgi:SAM-dependent methyltransferase
MIIRVPIFIGCGHSLNCYNGTVMSNEPGSEVSPRWVTWRQKVDLDEYDQRWEAMVERGEQVHGEMDFVDRCLHGAKADILDAGCGTGRLAIEASSRGHRCVGVDLDRDMIERARVKAPHITWLHADLAEIHLEQSFDVVVMAGNIPLFCAPGTQQAIIKSLASHLRPGGLLICGFSIEKRRDAYTVADFDRHATGAGLVRHGWYPSWDADGQPTAGNESQIEHERDNQLTDYAVVVYRR